MLEFLKHRKIVLAGIIVVVLLSFFLPLSPARAEDTKEKEGPVLELVYPKIPNSLKEVVAKEGLPGYINYMLKLSMALIGIIIALVLIYNGFKWFTSFGSAEKLSEAKKGITSSFLGAIILFSAYIIFNTINPQLTILELKDPDVVEPIIIPGIYICNYDLNKPILLKKSSSLLDKTLDKAADLIWGKVPPPSSLAGIEQILGVYTKSKDKEKIANAVIVFNHLLNNEYGSCFRVNSSGNLNFVFSGGSVFNVPEKKYIYDKGIEDVVVKWEYNYGIVFHEETNFKGQCLVSFPDKDKGSINISANPNITTRSITLYKLKGDESEGNKEVTLFECLDYNSKNGICPEETNVPKETDFFIQGNENYGRFSIESLKTGGFIKEENGNNVSRVRSIQFDPEGYFMAILFENGDFSGNTCEIISKNDNNLMDNPIGQCGTDCNKVINNKSASKQEVISKCEPCAKSMITIKGVTL